MGNHLLTIFNSTEIESFIPLFQQDQVFFQQDQLVTVRIQTEMADSFFQLFV